MKHAFRFWMTGCEAVVMSALGGARGALTRERKLLSRSSRFRVTETAERIEACAHKHGLSVFARLGTTLRQRRDDRSECETIVFESSLGGTPVFMEGPASAPEVPLSVCVRTDEAGDTEVVFFGSDWDDLPPNVMRDLTELPVLVADALQ